MPATAHPDKSAEAIRADLSHPVLDSDGHIVEFLPEVREHLREIAGDSALPAFDIQTDLWRHVKSMSAEEMRRTGVCRMSWWAFPAENTRDRATAMLPRLLHSRMDELGLDFAVLYPTIGIGSLSIDDAEVRGATVRAFNRYYAESSAGLADRIAPVAVIPMHTPEEAVAELQYCVRELGFKAAVFAGHVMRPVAETGDEMPRNSRFLDAIGIDSLHDYDPVWQACIELGIAPTFHSSAMGLPGRNALNNYVYNHIGNFAVAGEITCRALFLGGVTRRFPELRCAFLEGGVGWAANLFSDLIGHWQKRGAQHIRHYDPKRIDRPALSEYFAKYASDRGQGLMDSVEATFDLFSVPGEDGYIDEFAACEIGGDEDWQGLFVDPFHFGCEADDPMNARAFDTRCNPFGARFKAVFSSDIGHWDVPDMRGVLAEARELVDDGHIDEEDFRAFTFENPISLWCGANPNFFEGTAVADVVRAEIEG